MKCCILLAAYQGEKYLPAQLASISAQTETDFQVLYQDDGSTDRTPEILAEWGRKDPRFRAAAESGRHFGAAGNFISLLRQADADRIVFCDQDDVWEPEKLSSLLQACREALPDPESASGEPPLLVHSDASVIDGEGRLLAPSFFALQGWDPRAVHLNQLLVQNNVTGCLLMLNRPLAEWVIHFGSPGRMFMHDWFIALTAAAFGKIVFVERPLTRYRQHTENAIGASRSSLLRRGIRALGERQKARDRIALTYMHSQAFLEAFGDALPPDARKTVEDYLSTRSMPKIRRVLSVWRQGCRMQSPITRLGQFLFG